MAIFWGSHSRQSRLKKRPMKTANPQKASSGFLLAVVLTVFAWVTVV